MADSSWKREERILATMFGGQRLPNTGVGQPDIRADGIAVQAKKRKQLPQWLKDAVAQARRDAKRTEVPVVVLSEVRQGRTPVRIVCMDLADYLDWHR